jgi:hypothetical protein
MPRSAIFHRLKKYFRVALHCERTGQPAREALEELDHWQNKARERRRLLGAIGAGTALGALPAAVGLAGAVPVVAWRRRRHSDPD